MQCFLKFFFIYIPKYKVGTFSEMLSVNCSLEQGPELQEQPTDTKVSKLHIETMWQGLVVIRDEYNEANTRTSNYTS